MTGFLTPAKVILSKEDLDRFHASETFRNLIQFLEDLNRSVNDLSLRSEVNLSMPLKHILALLDRLEDEILTFPPVNKDQSRFGNPSFREWLCFVEKIIIEILGEIMPEEAAAEVSFYLYHSFGDIRRIDYGTGHEASFLAFMYCLKYLDIINEEDYPALVLRVFWKYIQLMRALQFAYWLEPAGSHGVWGLDDYHFLPFLFGSSQLLNHKYIKPKSIHNDEIVQEFSKDYIYFACIQFINSIKTESLPWHSPMLNDISGVKTWDKVNQGMIKMYKAEVMGKLPIMQHFCFGSILPLEGERRSDDEFKTNGNGDHVHVFALGQEFPQCCGIRVPSAIAVSKGTEDAMAHPNGKVVVKSTGPQLSLPFD